MCDKAEYWMERALKAEHAATHDAMTGLLNRAGLYRQDLTGYRYVTVADADGLKAVNDTLGHEAGDRLLCSIASDLLAAAEAAGGLAARTGGDEFVLLTTRLPELPADISASYGVTLLAGRPLDEAVSQADCKMYARKVARKAAR
jgi:GGDEF domain-containing protein